MTHLDKGPDAPNAEHLRRAIALAHEASERGDAPFGAVLVGEDGRVLAEGRNTQASGRDATGHAETNLLREAFRAHDAAALAASTLYTSGEPCAMCSGAIFWSGVGRVVYGMSSARLYELFPPSAANPVLRVPCREVLSAGSRPTEVVGPFLEDEAERVFEERRRGPRPTDPRQRGREALSEHGSVREVRVALTVADFEGAAALYGEALGLRVLKQWDEPHGRGAVFAAGAATIEIVDHAQAGFIDEVEAGERVSGPVRLALSVADVEGVAGSMLGRGAEAVAAPVTTPWGDRNQRLRVPDGTQLTLFREGDEGAD